MEILWNPKFTHHVVPLIIVESPINQRGILLFLALFHPLSQQSTESASGELFGPSLSIDNFLFRPRDNILVESLFKEVDKVAAITGFMID